MGKDKAETFIGFCIKSGNLSHGSGAISTLHGGVFLLIMDGDSAKNSVRLALKFKRRFKCPLLVCKQGFGEAVNKPGCKIVAIRDKNLANAILNNKGTNYELYAEGGGENG